MFDKAKLYVLFVFIFSSVLVASELDVLVNQSIAILNSDVLSSSLISENGLKDRFDTVVSRSIYIAETSGFKRDDFLEKFNAGLDSKLKYYESLIGSEPDSTHLKKSIASGLVACGFAYLAYIFYKSAKEYGKIYNDCAEKLSSEGVRMHVRANEIPLSFIPTIQFKLPFVSLYTSEVKSICFTMDSLLDSRYFQFSSQIDSSIMSLGALMALCCSGYEYDLWKRPRYKDYYNRFLFIKNRFQEYRDALGVVYVY